MNLRHPVSLDAHGTLCTHKRLSSHTYIAVHTHASLSVCICLFSHQHFSFHTQTNLFTYSCGQITLDPIILEAGRKFSFEITKHENPMIGWNYLLFLWNICCFRLFPDWFRSFPAVAKIGRVRSYLSTAVHVSLFTYIHLCSQTHVSFHIQPSLFIQISLFLHTYFSSHFHRSLFTNRRLFSQTDLSFHIPSLFPHTPFSSHLHS